MKSGEARLGEATTALTALLEAEGVEDARRKAHDFMTGMLRGGWRASAPAAYRPQPGGEHAHPDTAKQAATAAREALAEAKAKFAAREEGRRLASQRDDLIAAGVDPAELLHPIYPEETP